MSAALRLLAGLSGALAVPHDAAAQTPSRAEAQQSPRRAWAPPAAMERAVRDTVAARWGVHADEVRLSWLPPAAGASLGEGAPRLAGGAADGWWTASLPAAGGGRVLARVRAGVDAPVPTAARELPRGTVLEDEDIASTQVLRWGAPREQSGQVKAGWATRRVLAQGEALVEPAVAPPALVTARDAVRVQVVRGRARVELRGEAMESGALGERVRVRMGPGWQLEGTVTGEAMVRAGEEETSRT